MRSVLFAGLALALALPGVATGQTTTQCSDTFYGQPQLGQTCRTSAPRGPIDPATVQPKACNFAERTFGVDAEICEARGVAERRQKIGQMLAAGDCDAALKAALGTGDLTYAREVKAYCTPPAR